MCMVKVTRKEKEMCGLIYKAVGENLFMAREVPAIKQRGVNQLVKIGCAVIKREAYHRASNLYFPAIFVLTPLGVESAKWWLE